MNHLYGFNFSGHPSVPVIGRAWGREKQREKLADSMDVRKAQKYISYFTNQTNFFQNECLLSITVFVAEAPK